MTDPLIELIPLKPAACSDETITLDVLVRITPPKPEVHFPRPSLNLALLLDRSGSMETLGLGYAPSANPVRQRRTIRHWSQTIRAVTRNIASVAPAA